MAEKVKVSREVAEEISIAKSQFLNPYDAVRYLLRDKDFKLTEGDAINAVNGFLNGYEIEETQDEILLERYIQNNKNRIKAIQEKDSYQEGFALGYSMGVKDGLNFSGKKIKGINE